MSARTPAGVVALFIAPDGCVIASACDFDQARSGMPLEDAQETRARAVLAGRVVRALASPLLANALDGYALDVAMRKMGEAGCVVRVERVGGAAS